MRFPILKIPIFPCLHPSLPQLISRLLLFDQLVNLFSQLFLARLEGVHHMVFLHFLGVEVVGLNDKLLVVIED